MAWDALPTRAASRSLIYWALVRKRKLYVFPRGVKYYTLARTNAKINTKGEFFTVFQSSLEVRIRLLGQARLVLMLQCIRGCHLANLRQFRFQNTFNVHIINADIKNPGILCKNRNFRLPGGKQWDRATLGATYFGPQPGRAEKWLLHKEEESLPKLTKFAPNYKNAATRWFWGGKKKISDHILQGFKT